MEPKKIGIGVIGLGMGRSYLEACLKIPQVEIKAICDRDEERLRQTAREYGVGRAFTDYRQVIKQRDTDLIVVATPDPLHAEHCIAALAANKHVLCEKPLALSLADCKKMIRASDRSKAKFMVGQVCRFAPGFAQAKKLVASGEIGKLFFVESEYAHNYAAAAGVNNWRKDPARHPFLGGACHAVDLLRWLAGDAEEVFAYSNHTTFQDWPYDDCTIACFKFKSGTLGKVFCSIGCVRPYTMRSVFYGTAGTIICDNTSSSIQVCAKGKAGDAHAYKFETVPVEIASHNVAAELNHFVRCILNDQPVETDAREATRTVVTCLAAVVSARKKKPVTINYNFV